MRAVRQSGRERPSGKSIIWIAHPGGAPCAARFCAGAAISRPSTRADVRQTGLAMGWAPAPPAACSSPQRGRIPTRGQRATFPALLSLATGEGEGCPVPRRGDSRIARRPAPMSDLRAVEGAGPYGANPGSPVGTTIGRPQRWAYVRQGTQEKRIAASDCALLAMTDLRSVRARPWAGRRPLRCKPRPS